MSWRPLCSLVVMIGLVACASEEPPTPAGLELEALLPDLSSLGSWQIAEGPIVFTADTLWEYLDGGAPRYLDYGLVKMLHVRYQLGDDPLASVTVDVYDMAWELGAFGIYSSMRPSVGEVRSWGAEGYLSQTVAAAWKGSIFVHAVADDDRTDLVEALEAVVAHVCDAVAGEASPPAVLALLPPNGLVPHSERWVADDLLGHAALGGGLLATYEIDGRRGELFFAELADEKTAVEALQSVRDEMARWSNIAELPARRNGFRHQHESGRSGVVVREGRLIVGVSGNLTFAEQDGVLEQLIHRVGD